jgi:hypothetical protein
VKEVTDARVRASGLETDAQFLTDDRNALEAKVARLTEALSLSNSPPGESSTDDANKSGESGKGTPTSGEDTSRRLAEAEAEHATVVAKFEKQLALERDARQAKEEELSQLRLDLVAKEREVSRLEMRVMEEEGD